MTGNDLDGAHVLDALPAAAVVVDAAAAPVYANAAFARTLAIEPGDLTPDAIAAALLKPGPGAEPERLLGAVARAIDGDTERVDQVTVVTARGVLRRIAWTSPLRMDATTHAALVVFPAEEERFQVLLENTSDVITVLDPDGTIRYSNPAAGRLMAFEPGTVLAGTSGFDLVHPDDHALAIAHFEDQLNRPGVSPPVELRVRHGDGTWHTMEVSLANLVDHPAVGGVVITLHDVTDRRRAEQDVARSEQRFRSLVENLHDVIVVLDETATVTYASPAIEQVIGAPTDTNLGMSAFNDIHPDDLEVAMNGFEEVRAKPGGTLRMEIRLHHVVDDRWLWVEVLAANLLHEPAVQGIVCTLRDITAIKQAELVKDEFLATISHELRTPLTAIVGFTDVLRREVGIDGATKARLLERVAANAEQMATMVEQILSFSRLEAGRALVDPRTTELAGAIGGCVGELDRQLADHMVVTDVPTGLRAMADANAFGHVLRNLLTNAAKFSPAGSTIRVAAERLNGVVTISVTDEGPGVAPEDEHAVFERFYQGARAATGGRGTGLGLSIARRYTELQGGRIWYERAPDGGSTFTFTLPASDG